MHAALTNFPFEQQAHYTISLRIVIGMREDFETISTLTSRGLVPLTAPCLIMALVADHLISLQVHHITHLQRQR